MENAKYDGTMTPRRPNLFDALNQWSAILSYHFEMMNSFMDLMKQQPPIL